MFVGIQFDVPKCEFILKNSSLKEAGCINNIHTREKVYISRAYLEKRVANRYYL